MVDGCFLAAGERLGGTKAFQAGDQAVGIGSEILDDPQIGAGGVDRDRLAGFHSGDGVSGLRARHLKPKAGLTGRENAGIFLQAVRSWGGIDDDRRHDARISQAQAIRVEARLRHGGRERGRRLIHIDLTGEDADVARMAVIGNHEVALLEPVHGAAGGIVDEDIQLDYVGGGFQYDGLVRRLRNRSQKGLEE